MFGSTAVVLRAGRNYEAGEEFFVSYGPKGAAGYLEENGCAPVAVDVLMLCYCCSELGGATCFFIYCPCLLCWP